MTKSKLRLNFICVEVTVAYINIIKVVNGYFIARKLARLYSGCICQFLRKANR